MNKIIKTNSDISMISQEGNLLKVSQKSLISMDEVHLAFLSIIIIKRLNCVAN